MGIWRLWLDERARVTLLRQGETTDGVPRTHQCVDSPVEVVDGVREGDAQEALESAIDAEHRAGAEKQSLIACGESQLRADRRAEARPTG